MPSKPSLLSLAALVLLSCVACRPSPPPTPEPRPALPATADISLPPPQLVQQLGHVASVQAAVLAQEGRYAITAGRDHKAILWDVETGQQLRQFNGHVESINAAAVSDDFAVLATTGADGSIGLWDLVTGEELKTLGERRPLARTGPDAQRDNPVSRYDLAFVPGTRNLIYADGSTWRVFDTRTFEERAAVDTKAGPIQRFALAVDGKQLLTLQRRGEAQVWNLDSAQVLVTADVKATAAAWCAGSRQALLGTDQGEILLWDVAGGSGEPSMVGVVGPEAEGAGVSPGEARRPAPFSNFIRALACIRQGTMALAVAHERSLSILDLKSGRTLPVPTMPGADRFNAFGISGDGELALYGSFDGSATVWQPATGRIVTKFPARVVSPRSVAWSPSESYIATGLYNGEVMLWRTASGEAEMRRVGLKAQAHSLAFSGDSTLLVAGGAAEGTVRAWDAESGALLQTLDIGGNLSLAPIAGSNVVAVSVESREPSDPAVILWDWKSNERKIIDRPVDPLSGRPTIGATAIAASADGKVLVIGYGTRVIEARNIETQAVLGSARITEPRGDTISGIAVSADGSIFAATDYQGNVAVFSQDGTRLWAQRHEWGHSTVTLSSSGEFVAVGLATGKVLLYRASDGTLLDQSTRGGLNAWSIAFAPRNDWLLSAHFDGITRLWDVRTPKEGEKNYLTHTLSLVNSDASNWVVATPDGRFDTSGLLDKRDIGWVFANDPFRFLPLDLFMQDFFEPRLLARVLQREALPLLRNVRAVSRVRPKVFIDDVSIVPCVAQGCTVDTANLSVTVQAVLPDGTAGQTRSSGAYDLRVLRNGKVVRQLPESLLVAASLDPEAEREAWRQQTGLLKSGETKRTFTIDNVPVPHDGADQITFSAYAFNDDRIKGDTFEKVVPRTERRARERGRAFVVAIGINQFSDSRLSLSYAAADAQRMLESLREGLERTGRYTNVGGKLLTAAKGGRYAATKDDVRAALESLAERTAPATHPPVLSFGDQSPLGVNDTVIIFASTHGDRDSSGEFHLFPQDVSAPTPGADGRPIRKQTITSGELRYWLRKLDAGLVVLIIDACHAAAGIQGADFKPAPLASRGFGQLAYDKRMLVLTATRGEDKAFESGAIQHGLLTFALLNQGLAQSASDYRPADGTISAFELLTVAERAVPRIYADVRAGKYKSGTVTYVGPEPESTPASLFVQRPVLFTFADRREDMPLALTPVPTHKK